MSILCDGTRYVNEAQNPNGSKPLGTSRTRFTLPERIPEKLRRPTLLSYAAALRARGKDEDEILLALLTANRERCDPPLNHHQQRDLKRMAKWIAQKAPGTVHSNVANETLTLACERAFSFLDTFPWRGRFAQTCRVVYSALLVLVTRTNKGVQKERLDVSCRTLANMTGYSWKTVARALRALSGTDRHKAVPVLLYRFVPETRLQHRTTDPDELFLVANSYVLRNSPSLTHTIVEERNSGRSVCVNVGEKVGEVHDVFRGKRGLSTNYKLALDSVEREKVKSARQLAVKVNLSEKTAERALTVLKREQLIEKREGYWQRTAVALDDVARRRGTLGYRTVQRIEHERDSDTYMDVLTSAPRMGKLKLIGLERREATEPPELHWESEFRQAAHWKPKRMEARV